MNPLLVSGFGNFISVDKRKLVIVNKLENTRLEFLPHQILYDGIVLDSHTGSITFEAMRWLMKHDITLTLLNWNGNLLSVTLPNEPVSGKLRLKQYEAYTDNKRRATIGVSIIKEKVRQSINLLNELSKYYPEIRADKLDLGRLDSYDSLLTYEGNEAIAYWDNLKLIFNKLYPEFNFTGRNGRRHSWNMNASDEINALLNYGYALLESELRGDVGRVGLDNSIGFVHELKASRSSLLYDLQETFRWLIDLSVIQLLEEKKIKKTDFIVTESYNLRLRESGAKMLIEKVRTLLNSTAKFNGRNYSYRNILYENIAGFAKSILTDADVEFDIPFVKLKRQDTESLRDMILSMTPEKRKRLGLARNTVWYMQRNIREGKRIRIYPKVKSKISQFE
jgi:CRISPR-associated protein Cas1